MIHIRHINYIDDLHNIVMHYIGSPEIVIRQS